jgi:hypothetical protein
LALHLSYINLTWNLCYLIIVILQLNISIRFSCRGQDWSWSTAFTRTARMQCRSIYRKQAIEAW